MRELAGMLRGFRGRIALAAATGTGTVAAGVGLLATAAYLIVRAGLQPPILDLTVAIVGVRFFGIARAGLRYAERITGHDAALRLVASLRARSFDALERVAPAGIERERSGALLAGITDDLGEIEQALVRSVVPALMAAATVFLAGAAAAVIVPAAAPSLVAGLALTAAAAGGVTLAAGRAAGRSLASARGRLAAAVLAVAEGRSEALVLGAAPRLLADADEANRALARVARRTAWLTGGGAAAVAAGSGLTLWLVVRAAVAAADAGSLDPVLLGAAAMLAVASFEPVAFLPPGMSRLEAGADAARRLAARERQPDPVPAPLQPAAPPAPALELRDAGVRRRPGGRWDLRHIDLRIEPGRRIAIVGASGAGKTTLIEALLRFREIDEGSYRAGGRPVQSMAPDAVRDLIALADEGAQALDDTLGANLRLGRPDATDGELEHVLGTVGLDRLLRRLPGGLGARIGPHGDFVSGGERRRIALARALVADRPILVVDEPTAGLDPEAAEATVATLLRATAGKGLLMVTHGAAGLDRVDEILVLAGGEVVERGTHGDLLAAGGPFAALRSGSARRP